MQDVMPESRLVIVDEDGGRDMHGAHQHETFPYPARHHLFGNFVGDVDDFLAALRVEPEVVGAGGHGDQGLEIRLAWRSCSSQP
jgi:hypothetical protein